MLYIHQPRIAKKNIDLVCYFKQKIHLKVLYLVHLLIETNSEISKNQNSSDS